MKSDKMDKKIIYKFFDGVASKEEKAALKHWLEETPAHKDELLRERKFFDAMILSKTKKRKSSPKVKRFLYISHPTLREIFKIAAVVAVMFVIGMYMHTEKMKEIQSGMSSVSVPAGQRVKLVLPDGSNVWLNARSEMQYPAFFTGDKREVVLDGEAYFEVKHETDKPFIVHTGKCDIEVLGTKFNVEAYSDSDDFSTALMEGSVKITDRNNPANTLLLAPHNQARFDDGKLYSDLIDDYDPYRWREGLICFKNTDFAQLMYRFERSYGVRIIIENKNLSEHSISGKFRLSDGIDNALHVLQKNADFTFTKSEDESVIYIK